ncbi:MAG: NAD(P)-dependent oxidoreductase [Clostridia bacterium]|nr:NAD(P)-dependent oxidoreductase [Clostridia bacterium]
MMQNVLSEAKRCLKCKNAKCVQGCPIQTNIPEMMRLFEEGDLKTAGNMLFENNPLSIVCGLVCHHEAQCEGHCILNHKNQPIKIGAIEHYISDYNLDILEIKKAENNHKRAGIIGSGPAGITIAFLLAIKGYKVTIFESHDRIGGVLQYGIPDFRLPKTILKRIRKKLVDLGVQIRPNVLIGPVLTVDDMFADGYDSIFIGTGVWNPKKMRIKGESLGHVHFAIDYLKNPDAYVLNGHVTVIGAGNVAIDVARTAIRKGAKKVTLMYRKDRENMTASKDEVAFAELDGVQLQFGKAPVEIDDEGIWYQESYLEDEVWYTREERHYHETDAVIIAVSQAPRSNIVSKSKGIEVNKGGFVKADFDGQTSRQGVFASGDVVTGAKTVVEAVKYSKVVADAMDKYMSQL